MKYTRQDIAKLGTILGVWAHPDDECWSMAGIMAAAVQNGQRVVCITATKGEAGKTADETRWPLAELASIREQELYKALAILGIREHHWLDYSDGKLPETNPTEAVHRIAKIIAEVQPDSIFTFGPDGLTGHDDHRTMYQWTGAAARQANSQAALYYVTETTERYEAYGKECDRLMDIYYNVEVPVMLPCDQTDLCFELSNKLLELKLTALGAQACQTHQIFSDPIAKNDLEHMCACEYFMLDQQSVPKAN